MEILREKKNKNKFYKKLNKFKLLNERLIKLSSLFFNHFFFFFFLTIIKSLI
jgi:hypothetical protein